MIQPTNMLTFSRQELKELFVTAVVYLTIDIIYLSQGTQYYNKFFSRVQKSPLKFKKWAAVLSYSLLVLGIYFFIIKERKDIIWAFLFGLFVYGVYDLTNLATLTNWTIEFTVKDMLWGGSVFALSTFIIYEILKKI